MATRLEPFTLRVPEEAIADLRDRLARSRLPDQAPADPWAYGTDVGYLRQLVEYWRSTFDWRAEEARLNAFPQFKVPLGGIDLHFLQVPGKGPAPCPLLLLHGWPGSVFEFLELIPRLTDPARFGGDPADAFTVVAPSLPGYGLSFKSGQPRFGIEEIADCVAELMRGALGYTGFAVQGGDWGAITASRLGYAHPEKLIGIHLNLLAIRRDQQDLANPTPDEQAYLDDRARYGSETKPATSGFRAPSRRRSLLRSATRPRAWPRGSSRSSAPGRIAAAMSKRHSRATGCSQISVFIGSPARSARLFGPITRSGTGRGPFPMGGPLTSQPRMLSSRPRSCVHPARWLSGPTPISGAGP